MIFWEPTCHTKTLQSLPLPLGQFQTHGNTLEFSDLSLSLLSITKELSASLAGSSLTLFWFFSSVSEIFVSEIFQRSPPLYSSQWRKGPFRHPTAAMQSVDLHKGCLLGSPHQDSTQLDWMSAWSCTSPRRRAAASFYMKRSSFLAQPCHHRLRTSRKYTSFFKFAQSVISWRSPA